MGGRMMPVDCEHGVTVDWGDFGPCQDCGDHKLGACPNFLECPDCAAGTPHADALAVALMAMLMVVAFSCLITAGVMVGTGRYVYAVLFFVAYFLAHVVGCLSRDVWQLFDTDSFGQHR